MAAPRATTVSAAPSTSKRPVTVVSRLSGAAYRVSATTATHSGTLIAKIHRHEALSTSQPPSTGPIAAATPDEAGPGADRRRAVLGAERRLDERQRTRV